MRFAGDFISNFYEEKYPEIARGNFDFLPQVIKSILVFQFHNLKFV